MLARVTQRRQILRTLVINYLACSPEPVVLVLDPPETVEAANDQFGRFIKLTTSD